MKITQAYIYNFRNLKNIELSFSDGFNVISGRNGHGKTNIMEAIYLLSMPSSFRNGRLTDWIRFGETEASVMLSVENSGLLQKISMFLEDNKRTFDINKKKAKNIAELSKILKVIFFGPDDLRVIKNGPGERRRLMDRAIFRQDPSYLSLSQNYLELVRQRNSLIQDGMYDKKAGVLLDSYEERMVELGCEITNIRREFIDSFSKEVSSYWKSLGDFGRVDMEYRSGYGAIPDSDIQTFAMDRLNQRRRDDQIRGKTSVGPHLDNLNIKFNGMLAKNHASQGQMRGIVTALRIGELILWKKRYGTSPVLMMDDLSSELDQFHYKKIMSAISKYSRQVILTTTNPEFVLNDIRGRVFEVSDGNCVQNQGYE